MKILDTAIHKIDNWQQRHRGPAFIYAVIKKYGEDESGRQAALVTYYGFLSLFPLLMLLTTLTGLVASNNADLQQDIINSTTGYFPVLGSQLSDHIGTLHKNGLALAAGIVFTLYGARGVADAFRRGVQHIWSVPKARREVFPKTLLSSLAIIVIGGSGFILASVSAGWAAAAGQGPAFQLFSIAINLFVLFWLFTFLLNVCLPRHVPLKDTRAGAISAAIGLVVLQSLGGYLLRHELKSLDALYSYFAIALGLLFWIYLQAQVVCYSITIAAVRAQGLWPRKINDKN